MKECMDQILDMFIENNGQITTNMTNMFKITYKILPNISYVALLYSADQRTINPLEKALIDNLMLGSQNLMQGCK
jgi:hypothetical protein